MYIYKMYPAKPLHTFSLQSLAAIVLLIFYIKCAQRFVEMWDTFSIHFVYILCTSVVQILYIFCIQHADMISV